MSFPTAPWHKDYSYTETADGVLEAGTLHQEILNEGQIVAAVWSVTPEHPEPGKFRVEMKGTLSPYEEVALNEVVAAHKGVVQVTEKFDVTVAGYDHAALSPDGIPYSIPKVSGLGYVMNDRDILIATGVIGGSEAPCEPWEDLKVDVGTGERGDWGEVDFLGCWKVPSGSDQLQQCEDQADAEQHAICSIFDYQGRHPATGQPLVYELRGGSLYVDVMKAGLGDTIEERKAHQIYAVAAPDIPAAWGGQNRFFDGYLMGYEQAWMPAQSSDAMRLNPDSGSPAIPLGATSRLRVWFFYPPGTRHHHILRLVAYRWVGSF